MQHFRPHAVHYSKCNVRPVLCWIYMNAERAFAQRRVDDFSDCVRHRARIRVGRNNSGKRFLYFLSIAFVWTCFILGCALLVGGRAGMRKVIGAAGECAGNDDRFISCLIILLIGESGTIPELWTTTSTLRNFFMVSSKSRSQSASGSQESQQKSPT